MRGREGGTEKGREGGKKGRMEEERKEGGREKPLDLTPKFTRNTEPQRNRSVLHHAIGTE